MASDISLAVGDGARRMTYAELARAKGISLSSARQLVRRHHWPKQVGNDGYVKVTVPLAALTHVNTQDRDTGSDRGTAPSDTASQSKALKTRETSDAVSALGEAASEAPSDRGSDTVSETLSRAVDSLREQLGIANDRAERAERRINELQAALADERRRFDASETERRELSERLHRVLTHRRSGSVPAVMRREQAPWWRRWFR
jgi:hypothetical protein